MDDLISRAAAIETVYYKPNHKMAIEVLKEVPAVDAVPVVHGRWIYKERHRKSYRQYTGYDAAGETHTIMVLEESEGKEPYCSECEAQAAESFMDFCPHCGAKMAEHPWAGRYADQSGAEYVDNPTV